MTLKSGDGVRALSGELEAGGSWERLAPSKAFGCELKIPPEHSLRSACFRITQLGACRCEGSTMVVRAVDFEDSWRVPNTRGRLSTASRLRQFRLFVRDEAISTETRQLTVVGLSDQSNSALKSE
eukprot:3943871-Pyramimonas_sp.AAC.2